VTQPQARSAALPLGVVVALFAASLALRPQILAVGPLLPLIRADLELPQRMIRRRHREQHRRFAARHLVPPLVEQRPGGRV